MRRETASYRALIKRFEHNHNFRYSIIEMILSNTALVTILGDELRQKLVTYKSEGIAYVPTKIPQVSFE